MKKTIRITTGTYNTSDYKVVKKYKSKRAALKFVQNIGYVFSELYNGTWSHAGVSYNLSIG